MRTSTTTTLVAGVPGTPSFTSRATLRSRMIQVLIAIQPVAITIWKKAGRYAPLRPNALRVRTICVTPVRCPIRTNAPKITTPSALPTAKTSTVSQKPSPSTIPRAPSTQLIGAILAPAQIQNWSNAVASLYSSGTGVIALCLSRCVASASSVRSSPNLSISPPLPLVARDAGSGLLPRISSLVVDDLAHQPGLGRAGLGHHLAVFQHQYRRGQAPDRVPLVRGVNQHEVGRVPLGEAVI